MPPVFASGFTGLFRDTKEKLKVQSQADQQRALPRQFEIEVQWVEAIILSREIQKPKGHFRPPPRKTIAGQDIELPEVVPRQLGRITEITLRGPEGLTFGKESAGMGEYGKEIELMQDSAVVLVGNHCLGYFR